MLGRLGARCYRSRRAVLVAWLVVLAGTILAARAANFDTASVLDVPGSESQVVTDLLAERFPERAGDTGDLVFRAERGIDDPVVEARMQRLFERMRRVPHVTAVVTPYEPGPRRVSPDGRTALAVIQFDAQLTELRSSGAVDELIALRDGVEQRGLQVELGGRAVQFAEIEGPGGRSETIGLLVAVIVLLVSFGSVVAMGVPLLNSLFAIGVALSILSLLSGVVDMSDVGPQLAALIGLGVGIDYALLIVTRYRQGLHAGLDPEAAVVTAMNTAGRAVVFAGTTVMLSLSGMLVMGVPIMGALALGSGLAVVTVVIASLTLLPAVLGFAGRSIDRLRVGVRHRDEPDQRGDEHRHSRWFRWSRLVQRRPLVFTLIGLIVLVVLALPVLSLRLGSTDAGSNPTTTSSRRAYDLVADAFGTGFNGPLVLATRLDNAGDVAALDALVERLGRVDGVAEVSPPVVNRRGDTAIVTLVPTSAPQDEATLELINRLRDDVIPDATSGSGLRVHVGGITALFEDLGTILASRLPVFIAVVLGLSFVLLMMVFRSVLIPIKAVLMNLLSIGAAYGVVVAIFQWGWGKELIGIDRAGPIQSFVPLMLFAVLFGLSMDYEVFLLTRIREEYARTGDNGTAVADGLAATGRVITAAAAIMVAVFLSSVLGDDQTTKLFGVGMATAIFVDATVVRTLLVPATMELLGRANWWMPRWLDRVLPAINVENQPAVHPD